MVVAHKHSTSVALGNKYKNGSYCVRIRVSYAGSRTDLHTKLSATEKQWDSKKQRFKQGVVVGGVQFNVLNATIDTYIGFVDDYFNKASLREAMPSLQDLKQQFNYTFKQSGKSQSDEFFFVFDKYIETRSETRRWSDEYKEMFTRVRSSLEAFKNDIRFTDFSVETMNKYVQHLSQTMYNDKIGKVLSMLKEFLTYAFKKNYPVNKEYFEYVPKLPQSSKVPRHLTIEELKTIINLDLEVGSAMDMTRDFFVFQCFTALRYSDIKQLKHDNIREVGDGSYEIDILTKKDKDRITIPLAKVATRIYEKYKDNIYDDGVVFPVISNQKYNKHLKELGKLAELKGEWKDYHYKLDKVVEVSIPKADLTSHTARRTFVTIVNNEGVGEGLIAQVTSHSDMKSLGKYKALTRKGTKSVIDALDKAVEE